MPLPLQIIGRGGRVSTMTNGKKTYSKLKMQYPLQKDTLSMKLVKKKEAIIEGGIYPLIEP